MLYVINRGYQMSVLGLIQFNKFILNELNESILCEPLANIIHVLFYAKSSINLEINLHEFNVLFITYHHTKRTLNCKKDHFHRHAYNITQMFSALLTLCLYSANDVTSKCYYTSVISFLLHGFITLRFYVIKPFI